MLKQVAIEKVQSVRELIKSMAYKIPQLLKQYSVSILLVISPLVHNNYNTSIYFSEAVMDKFSGADKSDLTKRRNSQ